MDDKLARSFADVKKDMDLLREELADMKKQMVAQKDLQVQVNRLEKQYSYESQQVQRTSRLLLSSHKKEMKHLFAKKEKRLDTLYEAYDKGLQRSLDKAFSLFCSQQEEILSLFTKQLRQEMDLYRKEHAQLLSEQKLHAKIALKDILARLKKTFVHLEHTCSREISELEQQWSHNLSSLQSEFESLSLDVAQAARKDMDGLDKDWQKKLDKAHSTMEKLLIEQVNVLRQERKDLLASVSYEIQQNGRS